MIEQAILIGVLATLGSISTSHAQPPTNTFEDMMIVVDAPEDAINVISLPPRAASKSSQAASKGQNNADEAKRNSVEAREEVRDSQVEDDKGLLEVILDTVVDVVDGV